MKELPKLFIDLDDTLIQTQVLYDTAKQKILEYILKTINDSSLTEEFILKKFQSIDIKNVKIYGLSKKRFPTSWVDTFESLLKETGRNYDDTLDFSKHIYELADNVFNSKAELYPSVHEVLTELKNLGVEMNLLTSGDYSVQQKRIHDAKIKEYFQDIFIVPTKTPETVRNILANRNPNNCIMIGNSYRSDIYPSLELGMKAIHIEKNTWIYDEYKIDESNQNYIKTELEYVPKCIIEMIKKEDTL